MPIQYRIENLTKVFELNKERLIALKNINFTIQEGDFIGVYGHSGSGKTTLLALLGGLLRPTEGRIFFYDKDLTSAVEEELIKYRQRISYLFQYPLLFMHLSSLENVLFPFLITGKKISTIEKEKAEEILIILGLKEKIKVPVYQLSGGQQRRVCIARALITNPLVILADEPTGDLDPQTEKEVLEIFKNYNQTQKITFIIATHSEKIVAYTNKIITLKNGEIVSIKNNNLKIGN